MRNDKKYLVVVRWFPSRGGTEDKPNEINVVYSSVKDAESKDNVVTVSFPVSQKYDLELQEKRAQDYADYLNKLDEAAKIAYDQIHLTDILKR